MRYKFLPHTADIKFRAYGSTIEEAFLNSLLALVSSVSREKIKGSKALAIKVSGKDYENLLYNFLEEILFLIDSKNFFPSGISNLKIDKKKLKLSGKLSGDYGDKYKIYSHIKSATYSEMLVENKKGRWIVQAVLDV
jgi:SHS2 domain-containing protein